MTGPALPSALALTRPQFDGWACVWCGITLLGMTGVVSAGRATGAVGAHDMSVEVYACPVCAIAPPPQTPAARVDASRGQRDGGRISPGMEDRPSR